MFNMMKNFLVIAVWVMLATSSITHATPMFDLGTEGSFGSVGNSNINLGFDFTISSQINVGGLGVWDIVPLGLTQSFQVGLWNNLGELLASTTVTSESTAVASANENGQWLFNYFTPFAINPGRYVLGLFQEATGPDVLGYGFGQSLIDTDPAFTYGGTRYSLSGSFGIPYSSSDPPGGWFGPNLDVARVPAPATLALFCLGLAGLAASRRRKV